MGKLLINEAENKQKINEIINFCRNVEDFYQKLMQSENSNRENAIKKYLFDVYCEFINLFTINDINLLENSKSIESYKSYIFIHAIEKLYKKYSSEIAKNYRFEESGYWEQSINLWIEQVIYLVKNYDEFNEDFSNMINFKYDNEDFSLDLEDAEKIKLILNNLKNEIMELQHKDQNKYSELTKKFSSLKDEFKKLKDELTEKEYSIVKRDIINNFIGIFPFLSKFNNFRNLFINSSKLINMNMEKIKRIENKDLMKYLDEEIDKE